MITYERFGDCWEKCGAACCRNLFNPSDDTAELLEPVNGICKFLDQKTNKCSLHDINKPPLCRAFPYENNPGHHNYRKVSNVCGYGFKEIDTELE
ncbi:MAG: hypothetical protein U9O94_01400 [Nanoarchaeota archaeon]|nr:hypothetical protein [Nanoarchaeota archaeon]